MRNKLLHRGWRLLLVCALLWLGACGGQWPMGTGGYIDLSLECTDDQQCQRFAPEKLCRENVCACPEQTTSCGPLCVNLQQDPLHCGECDQQCGGGSACCEGKCCDQGLACCGKTCADLDEDPKNCGSCGNVCKADERCCEGKCTNIHHNNQSCGGCGVQCSAALKPIVQEKKQTKDGESLRFVFENVMPPSAFATMTLQVNLFGAYANLLANAQILINGVEQGLLPGGSQCNLRRVPGHSKRFLLPKSALKEGKLTVDVLLSSAVIASRCSNPRAVVSLSFGLDQCCSGSCVDVTDNVEHCGACGSACAVGATCCDNGCCPLGYLCCDGGCCRTLQREGDAALSSISARHDGKFIMVASEQGVWIWDFQTGQYKGLLRISQANTLFDDIAFHPVPPNAQKKTGVFLAAVSKKSSTINMMVGNLPNGVFQIRSTIRQINTPLSAFAWRADGKYFAVGSATTGEVHLVHAENIAGNSKTWKLNYLGAFKDLKQPILRIKTSRDGRWLSPISVDGKAGLIEIGRLPTNTIPAQTFSSAVGTRISDIALHPDGTKMAVALIFEDQQQKDKSYIELRDLTKANYPVLGTLRDVGNVVFATYNPDGTRLALGNIRGDVQIWDVANKRVEYVFRGHKARVLRLMYHPNGKSLATISHDRGIQIWAIP